LWPSRRFALLISTGEMSLTSTLFEPYILRVLRFTLLQALLSTLLSILLAIPIAQALARQPRFRGRIWIIRLMAVPMGLPVLIGALGLIGIWGRQGIVNSLLDSVPGWQSRSASTVSPVSSWRMCSSTCRSPAG
jgi:thiamine transport system permease protein